MRQHGKSSMNPTEKIQDMLISVAVLLDSTGPSSFEKLSETAGRLADAYRFIDFLIVGDVRCEFDEKAFARVVALCPQSRYLQIEGAFGYDDLIRFACGEVIGDTVHFDIIDQAGNMVSSTPSGGWLQSSPVIPELGFCLGTRAQQFWLEEDHPNSLAPGKRPRTSLSPTMALRDGEPYLAWGSPGGDQQDQWTALFFLRHVHGKMNLHP